MIYRKTFIILTDRQFDLLAGLSSNMEKSLDKIEKSLNISAGAGTNAISGLAQSLNSIVTSLNSSSFNSKNANDIISFSRSLVSITNSVLPSSSKAFTDFMAGVSVSIDSITNSIDSSSIKLLEDFANGLSTVMTSISPKKFNAKKGNEILIFTEGLVKISNTVKPSSAKGFGEFATGLSAAFDMMLDVMSPMKMLKLHMASKMLFEGKNPLLKRMATGMSNAFKDLDTKKAKEGSEALKILGDGLLSLVKALKGFILIGIAAPLIAVGALVVRGVIALFSTFGKKAKEIKEGGDALKSLGKGLLSFSAGLATLALVTIVAGPAVMAGIAIISLFGLTFWALGKASESIQAGAKSVALMGLAIFGFSAAIATLMLVMIIVKPAAILAGIMMIAGFAVVFALIGKADSIIADGALLLIGMSFAIAFFGLGLLVFGAALKLFSAKELIMGAALILELGLAMAILGKFEKQIVNGAVAMAEMGIGLLSFSIGAVVFGLAVKLFDAKDIATGALLIVGLGAAFAAVGLLASSITAGALAVGEMGGALIMFSAGILVFGVALKLLQVIFKGEMITAGALAGGIILGLGVAFAGVGLMSAAIIPGAVALASMGASLIAFSVGILVFALAIKALGAMFDDLKESGKLAGGIILGMGVAFSAMGLLSIPIVLGASAVLAMGAALSLFSVGLILFGGVVKILTNIFDDEIDKIGEKTGSFLLSMGMAFSSVGLRIIPIMLGSAAVLAMGGSMILFGAALFTFGAAMNYINNHGLMIDDGKGGTTMKGVGILTSIAGALTDVGMYAFKPLFWSGIAASIGMGASLLSIGIGLKTAADALEKVPKMDNLIANLFSDDGLIPSMAKSFANIGKKYGGSLLSSFLGTDDVSIGIRTVKGFGDVLSELAGGIVAFANFSEFPVKVPDAKDPSKLIYRTVDIFTDIIPALNSNLPILLGALASTFTDIGSKYGGDGGWFGGDSPVQKGINAVKGLGTVLSELAGGIVAFANFTEFPVQIPDPKDPSKLIYKTVDLMAAIPAIKVALIGDGVVGSSNKGILFGLANVFAKIGEKYGDGFWTDGPVKKGIDAVKGIGGVISELANGIIAFANMNRGLPNYDKNGKFNGTYTPFKLEDVKNNIVKVLNVLPEIFAGLDVKKLEDAREKAKIALPLAESITKIGKALQALMVDKGKGDKVSMVELIGPSLKKFVADTKDLKIDKDTIGQLQDLSKVLEKFSSIGNGLKSFAEALKDTGTSFGLFARGFGAFSLQLDKFVTFENAFSNLVKNQHVHGFDKFSKSMGVMKENVNAFNVENLKLTDSLMKSLATLSKSPDAVGDNIKKAIDAAMKQLVDAIKLISENSNASNARLSESIATSFRTPAPAAPVVQTTTVTNQKQPAQPMNNQEIQKTLTALTVSINSLASKFQVGTGGGIKVVQIT